MLDSSKIKELAQAAGFDLCGIAPCHALPENGCRLQTWLDNGYGASLGYMARNVEKRVDPRLLFEGARTVVVCAVNYKNSVGAGYPADCRTKIASYACTRDYHLTIKEMLGGMLAALKVRYPDLRGRAFVDTAPIFEKQWAVEAGLGWIGRQSLLVTPQFGTYILLGELLLTDEADCYDTPFAGSRCGDCSACLDNCPTRAIVAPKVVDTRHCISCHTVEKEQATQIDLDGWIFGCDACQSCCPYNRRTPMHIASVFDRRFDPLQIDAAAWRAMSNEAFDRMMGDTPLARSGLKRIQGNIKE